MMLTVRSYNSRAIRAYEKAGFRLIGRRRQARRVGDAPYDLVLMDCIATEFPSGRLTQSLAAISDRIRGKSGLSVHF